jgi:hypothetical protein
MQQPTFWPFGLKASSAIAATLMFNDWSLEKKQRFGKRLNFEVWSHAGVCLSIRSKDQKK